ncbi:MAG: rhodanese-like domain-containing protein [Myxococcaceae bacterium]|nr:rhodanese-like domain-containing protein [Myxococcaceae bacterium]
MALKLRSLGYPEAYALEGGWDAWVQAGLPTEPKEGAGAHV